jgi:hypothetical protein
MGKRLQRENAKETHTLISTYHTILASHFVNGLATTGVEEYTFGQGGLARV